MEPDNPTPQSTTVSQRMEPPPLPKRRHHILQLFTNHGWAARLWFAVAVIALATAFLQPYLIISAYRTQERVVILDESGTFHVSPLLNFEDATRLHTSQAILASLALFQRHPHGFDWPELLEKLFLDEAFQKAKQLKESEAPEFQAKQIHQKVEIFKMDILETRNDFVLVEVEGQLVRLGVFNRETFAESPKFKARFTMIRNPNLALNGRYPLAIWKFDLQYL